MEVRYRRNTASDSKAVKALLDECFGYTAITGARIPVGAYLLAFDGDNLIALTGILENENTDYDGAEIGWTCCKKEYRGLGIISTLINMELVRVGKGKDIYCECWSTNNVPHLKSAMLGNGFALIQEIHKRQQDRYKSCESCVYKDNSGLCRCGVVLYKRKAQYN